MCRPRPCRAVACRETVAAAARRSRSPRMSTLHSQSNASGTTQAGRTSRYPSSVAMASREMGNALLARRLLPIMAAVTTRVRERLRVSAGAGQHRQGDILRAARQDNPARHGRRVRGRGMHPHTHTHTRALARTHTHAGARASTRTHALTLCTNPGTSATRRASPSACAARSSRGTFPSSCGHGR